MLNPSFFNMRPARDYVEACRALENVQIVQNDFFYEDDALLTPAIRAELGAKGFEARELLAYVHTLVAQRTDSA